MKVKTRGCFRVLDVDGAPVAATLVADVTRAPHETRGKWYASLAVVEGDVDALRAADAKIIALAKPEFSPFRESAAGGVQLVVKMTAATAAAWPADESRVRVTLSVGPFGGFGYCLTASNVAAVPASTAVPASRP